MTFFVHQDLRDNSVGNLLRETFDYGSLAHASFADEYGIVFRATAKNLNDTTDFVFATDDRVHLSFACELGEITAKSLERGCLDFLLVAFGAARGGAAGSGGWFVTAETTGAFRAGELRIEFAQNFVASALDIDVERLEHAGCHALSFAEKAEENVLSADVGMVERFRLLAGEREDFFHARRVGNAAGGLRFLAGADLFLDGGAYGFEVEPHFLEHAHGNALAELNQAKQNVLGADVVMVEAIGFLASEGEHLLRSRREVVHRLHGGMLNWFARIVG